MKVTPDVGEADMIGIPRDVLEVGEAVAISREALVGDGVSKSISPLDRSLLAVGDWVSKSNPPRDPSLVVGDWVSFSNPLMPGVGDGVS